MLDPSAPAPRDKTEPAEHEKGGRRRHGHRHGREPAAATEVVDVDWTELAEQTVDNERLVLAVGHWDHFVFLHAEREPMRAPRLDHFGMSVRSRADLDGAWSRVAAWAGRDDRIDTIDPHVDDFGPVKIHSFYVRHLMPLMVEVPSRSIIGLEG